MLVVTTPAAAKVGSTEPPGAAPPTAVTTTATMTSEHVSDRGVGRVLDSPCRTRDDGDAVFLFPARTTSSSPARCRRAPARPAQRGRCRPSMRAAPNPRANAPAAAPRENRDPPPVSSVHEEAAPNATTPPRPWPSSPPARANHARSPHHWEAHEYGGGRSFVNRWDPFARGYPLTDDDRPRAPGSLFPIRLHDGRRGAAGMAASSVRSPATRWLGWAGSLCVSGSQPFSRLIGTPVRPRATAEAKHCCGRKADAAPS
jgi:hypothetical protein